MNKLDPSRLSIEEQFDLLALIFACRGTCNRLRIGTVIRSPDKKLISGGYNGAISGAPHCDEIGHLMEHKKIVKTTKDKNAKGHCIRTNHSEENAIFNCLDLSYLKGGIATSLGTPCNQCARRLIGLGIKKLRYIAPYENYSDASGDKETEELCKTMGVEIENVDSKNLFI